MKAIKGTTGIANATTSDRVILEESKAVLSPMNGTGDVFGCGFERGLKNWRQMTQDLISTSLSGTHDRFTVNFVV